MEKYDIVIAGAGISGLTLAHYCVKAGLSTLVLEKADRAGGCFHSHEFGGDAEGFWAELGAHTCYNSYARLIGIFEDIGLMGQLVSREKVPFRMLADGRLVSIPSRLDFLELIFSLPKMLTAKKEGESMESYYSRILGRNNYSRALGPVFNAIISQDAAGFPADALFKKREKRRDVMKSYTFTNGLQTVISGLSARPGQNVMLGREVESVEFSDGVFITTAGGSRYESRFAAVACPPPAASKVLSGSFPELSSHLSRIPAGTVETVGVALHKDEADIPPVAGIIAADDVFLSAVSRDVVKDDRFRGFAFHFRPGMAGKDEKLARIAAVLKVKPEQLTRVAYKDDNSVPSLTVGHSRWVAEADRLVAGSQLLLAGNYFSGVAIEDCVVRSFQESERLRKML
jgi:protoporphyrinogen oxidase